MDYLMLGRSNLRVSRIGFGCDPMGGHAWGRVESEEVERAVHRALDLGLNLFDTADCYGLGRSEEILGKCLSGRRGEAVVATKFGVRKDPSGRTIYDNSPDWLDHALEGSLRRLRMESIDLYQVHYCDRRTPVAEILDSLENKRRQGKILYYGVTNTDLQEAGISSLPPGCISFSFEYSLANRAWENVILDSIEAFGLGFLSWGSLGQGILTGKYAEDSTFPPDDRRSSPRYVNFHGDKLLKNLEIVEAIGRCSDRHPGSTKAQVAIRWILDHIQRSVALVGIKTCRQLEDNLTADRWRLSPEDLDLLDRASLPRASSCLPCAHDRSL